MNKFFYLLIILLAMQGCNDDDCPIEPDPCSEYPKKMEIILELNRIENGNIYDDLILYEDTTLIRGSYVNFTTNFSYDSLKWLIGNEAGFRTGSKITVDFGQFDGKVLIRACGYRSINTECFGSSDDGKDTLYKEIELIDWWKSPLFGTYRGTYVGESDSFNVVIGNNPEVKGAFTYYRRDSAYYQGIPKGTIARRKFFMRWHALYGQNNWNEDGIDEKMTYGTLIREDRDILELTYKVKNTNTDITFRGRRIK